MSNENIVSFTKNCLRDEGYSKELITYLLSTYDLESFIASSNMNKLEVATHFLGHARNINLAATNY